MLKLLQIYVVFSYAPGSHKISMTETMDSGISKRSGGGGVLFTKPYSKTSRYSKVAHT
jgi:hypothetical protein